MYYLCIQCGHINNNESFICSNCTCKINNEDYERLRQYANRAVQYGYKYRIEYERQILQNGKINVKYSLLEPELWYEWLAMAALGGIVGNYATDLINYVGKQIVHILKDKENESQLSESEKEIINIVQDNKEVNRFNIYINNYYCQSNRINEKVNKAIREEEFADELTNKDCNDIMLKFSSKDIECICEMISDAAQRATNKRNEKPDIAEITTMFKPLKRKLRERKKKQ